jgi:hypothetical protein
MNVLSKVFSIASMLSHFIAVTESSLGQLCWDFEFRPGFCSNSSLTCALYEGTMELDGSWFCDGFEVP